MNNVQDVRAFGRDYSGMAIAIIILAGIHVILSLVFSVMAYRKGLRKEGGAWLLSFGVWVAILVLAAVATGQKDNYSKGQWLPDGAPPEGDTGELTGVLGSPGVSGAYT